MLYREITIANKEYKLRLNAKACVSVEKKLGRNPLSIFVEMETSGNLPKLGELITIFHSAIQKHDIKVTEEGCYDIYEEYIEEGGSFASFMGLIVEVFKVSGFFQAATEEKEVNGEDNEKN